MNYKQYNISLRDNGDMLLKSMTVGEQHTTVSDLMDSLLGKYIGVTANDCGYGGTSDDLIVNDIHLLFLKAKYSASR